MKTAKQRDFVACYLANGGNAAKAYRDSHPGCTANTARVEGSKSLTKPDVSKAITVARAVRAALLGMDADEATMLVSMRARADLRLAYDLEGRPLHPKDWPTEFACAVKSRKRDGSIVLIDQQKATETILQMLGKLKTTIDVNNTFDHLGYLADKQRAADAAEEAAHEKTPARVRVPVKRKRR